MAEDRGRRQAGGGLAAAGGPAAGAGPAAGGRPAAGSAPVPAGAPAAGRWALPSWRTVRPVVVATRESTVALLVSLVVGSAFACATAVSLVGVVVTSWIVGLGTTVRAATLRLAVRMARVDRRRLARATRVVVEPLPEPRVEPGASFRARQAAWARSTWLWRLPAYQLLRIVLVCALAFGAVTWWWATIDCFVLAAGPAGPLPFLGWSLGPVSPSPAASAALVLAGLGGMLGWPVVVRAVPAGEVALGRWLLGPSRANRLTSEVSRLSEARSLAVASAEAERRRIERDLHDGLQPQLVNLALDLGLARSRLRADPDAATALVTRAHGEAKRAAEDLRNLVRGIHPSVLDERGLDAALSALVAGCGVPVAVHVDLPQRPPQAAEATAYFVVAEAITNVTKHARARRAAVAVTRDGHALRVVVEDNGCGGARPEPGGGLAGLEARVAAVDGTLSVASPAGGPTRLEAVIPCAP